MRPQETDDSFYAFESKTMVCPRFLNSNVGPLAAMLSYPRSNILSSVPSRAEVVLGCRP